MPHKRLARLAVAAVCLSLVCACGGPESSGGPGDDGEISVDLTVPAQGGTIAAGGGITVVAPAGAVAADTPISIVTMNGTISKNVGYGSFSAAVECGPSGTTFASPIEIRIPVAEAPASAECALFSREGSSGAWTQLDQDGRYDAAGKYISLKTTHFSSIAYSNIPAPGIRVFADTFAEAGDWRTALSSLRELLVGAKGVMGVKQKVGDDTYKVCGVDIDVQYKFGSAENQHVGDLTGEKTNDYTSLTYYRDDSTANPDMTIISDTRVLIYWKKVVTERYLVTYDFTAAGGEYLMLNGYSSRMYFTVEVPAEENAAVDMEKDEDITFDAYFTQTAPTSIIPDIENEYFTNIGCPAAGTLAALIGGSTAPGSCNVALMCYDPEYFVTAYAWTYDEDGDRRVEVLDPELWLIGGDTDDFEMDGSLTVVLKDGYTGSGYAKMAGLLGVARLGYTVKVRKLP